MCWEASVVEVQGEAADGYGQGIWYLHMKFQRIKNSIKMRLFSQAVRCPIRLMVKPTSKGHKLSTPERNKAVYQTFPQTPELTLSTNPTFDGNEHAQKPNLRICVAICISIIYTLALHSPWSVLLSHQGEI